MKLLASESRWLSTVFVDLVKGNAVDPGLGGLGVA